MEIWKDIPGYEGLYQVSNLGRVKSLLFRSYKTIFPRSLIMNTTVGKRGYVCVGLYKDNKAKTITVHRLVAKAFILNIENKLFVNHKNGIKTDNRVENLEWCTQSENMIHAYHTLGVKRSQEGKFGKLHPNSKKVKQYTLDGEFIKTWDNARDITRELGIAYQNINKVCKGKRNHAGGYNWQYLKKA